MGNVLFHLGPYQVAIWNMLVIGIIIVLSILVRRIIHRKLKRYLVNANIQLEGKRVTLLRLFTQLVYFVAFYLIFLTLSINNAGITFVNLLDAPLISPSFVNPKKFNLTFSHILTVLFIIFSARVFIHLLGLAIGQRLRSRRDYDPGTEFVYLQIAKYIVYLISAFLVLKVLFTDVSAILTGSIGIFLGIGLGLQDVFKDFFAGIVLLLEGNIKVGDVIQFQSGGSTNDIVAKVIKINVRTSHIETRDGNVLIIPNTRLTQENVENWSHGSEISRFVIELGIAYDSDMEEVIRLLKQAALSHPKVKKTLGVTVRLANFAESSIRMELIFWADQSWEINNCKSEIRLEINRLFREYKVTIPFPQRDMHVKEAVEGKRNDLTTGI